MSDSQVATLRDVENADGPPSATLIPDEAKASLSLPNEKPRYPGSGTLEDPYVVDWADKDPENPFNWSKPWKWAMTLQVRLFPVG